MQNIHSVKISYYKVTKADIELFRRIQKSFLYDDIEKFSFLEKLIRQQVGQHMILAIGDMSIQKISNALNDDGLKELIRNAAPEVIYGQYEVTKDDIRIFQNLKNISGLSQDIITYVDALLKLNAGDLMIKSFNGITLSELAETFYGPGREHISAMFDCIKHQENSFIKLIQQTSAISVQEISHK